jgi:hypothetical protein
MRARVDAIKATSDNCDRRSTFDGEGTSVRSAVDSKRESRNHRDASNRKFAGQLVRNVNSITSCPPSTNDGNTCASQTINVAQPEQHHRRIVIIGEFAGKRCRPSRHHTDARLNVCIPERHRIYRLCSGTALLKERRREAE